MKTRNYTMDFFKGLSALMVMWLHVGTFLYKPDTVALVYTRAIASLCVPVFFIISGYFMGKSKNLSKSTIKLIKLFLLMVVITAIFDYAFGIVYKYDLLHRLFLPKSGSVGYLWFIRDVIYMRVIYQFARKTTVTRWIYIIGAVSIGMTEIFNASGGTRAAFLYIGLGLIYQHLEAKHVLEKIKFPNILICLSPVVLVFKEKTVFYTDIPTFIATNLVFMFSLKYVAKSNVLSFFANNTIQFLFVHYFVVELLMRKVILPNNNFGFLGYYIAIVGLSSLVIIIYQFLKTKTVNLVHAKL